MSPDQRILLAAAAVAVALGVAVLVVGFLILGRLRGGMSEVAVALGARVESSGAHLQARLEGATALVNQRLDAVTGQVNERLRETADALERRLADTTGSLDRRLSENTRSLDERLAETMRLAQQANRTVGERLESVSRVVGDVHASLGQMGEANRRIFEVGQSIASLQEILQAPKLRGGLGELFLAEVLGQILTPEHYELQHRFRSGETVDAVVRLGGGLVPIDSKFPLESFRRMMRLTDEAERARERRVFAAAVKRHVDSIANKYILPDEDTFEFAFMYVPAENVYYEVILRDEDLGEGTSLLEHALRRHVIPVSPSSFYAYLQSILLGLRGLRIEQRAREIGAHLARLGGDFERFGDCFDTMGKHLKNAQNAWDKADGLRKKFEAKLEATAELEVGAGLDARALEGGTDPDRAPEMPLFAGVEPLPGRPERVG